MKVIVYKGANDQYRCRVVDDNDKAMLNSELIDTHEDALKLAKGMSKQYDAKIEDRVAKEVDNG